MPANATELERLTELRDEAKTNPGMAAHRIRDLERERDQLRTSQPGLECSTYEWLCTGCGQRTWTSNAGGEINCDCPPLPPFDWNKPKTPAETAGRIERGSNTHVWRMIAGEREYFGTATSLTGETPKPTEPTLFITAHTQP